MATTKVGIAPMKVAQISKPGGDFEIVEREIPNPGFSIRGFLDRSVAYVPSSTLDSRRDRPVTNYFLNAWVLRTDKTNLHAKNQRSVTDAGAALPPYLNQTSLLQDLYMMSYGTSGYGRFSA